MLEIHENNGFKEFNGVHGAHSNVFEKQGHVYKVSSSNSMQRALEDYQEYQEIFKESSDKILSSEIFPCLHKGQQKICVKQKRINGIPLKKLNEKELKKFLKKIQKIYCF